MIAYKVVNKRNRSIIVDYINSRVKDPVNKYSTKYPIGKIVTVPKYTLGMFLCTTLEEAIDWKNRMDYSEYDPKILLVEILDKPYIPKKMCSEINPKYIDLFYNNGREYTESFVLFDTVCSYKIRVLEEVKDNE